MSTTVNNPNRIPHTLAALERYWMQHPEKSLSQIVLEFSLDADQSTILVTDEKFLENLNKVQWN